jgi:hypothetical protein
MFNSRHVSSTMRFTVESTAVDRQRRDEALTVGRACVTVEQQPFARFGKAIY